MAQPSSTQPKPQATVEKSDEEMADKAVNGVKAKDDSPKAAETQPEAAAKPETSAKPEVGEQPTAEPQPTAASQPAAATESPAKPAETTAAKPDTGVPASTVAPAPAAPAVDKPADPAPVDASDATDAPTLPNISASQVAAALQASAAVSATPPLAKTEEPAKKGEPSFLYVEDDPFSREVITRLIKQNMGFPNLTVFADSSDFMGRVKNLPAIPDVFLLDIQISPLNGHQMLKLLRDDDTFKKSKIIALTASVMASEVKQLQDAGFDGLIGKPVMKRVFPELLQKVLDGEAVWYVS